MEVAGEKGVTATAPETRPRVRGLAIVRLRARSPAVAGIRETRGSVYPPSPPAPSPPTNLRQAFPRKRDANV
jgi:hypothetical protein